MKAKEMAEYYNNAEDKYEALQTIMNKFVDDLQRIPKERGCKKAEAFKSVILELDDKWKALARRTGLNPQGFELYLKKRVPFIWDLGFNEDSIHFKSKLDIMSEFFKSKNN